MDRKLLLQHLAQAQRHVEQGDQHIFKQEALIAQLERGGHDTKAALKILDTLRRTQTLHREDLERVLKELAT